MPIGIGCARRSDRLCSVFAQGQFIGQLIGLRCNSAADNSSKSAFHRIFFGFKDTNIEFGLENVNVKIQDDLMVVDMILDEEGTGASQKKQMTWRTLPVLS